MSLLRMRREALAFRFLFLGIIAVLLMAGCASAGNQNVDEAVVQTSPEAARDFVEKVVATGREGADGAEVALTVTQEELSSFLDLASRVARVAAAQGADSLSDVERLDPATLPEGARDVPQLLADMRAEGDLPDVTLPDLEFWSRVTEPRVRFNGNGQIVVTGLVDLLGFQQRVRIVALPRPEGDKVFLTFVEGSIGSLPVPAFLAEQVVANTDALLLMGQDYADISTVTVSEGQMSVTGHLEQ